MWILNLDQIEPLDSEVNVDDELLTSIMMSATRNNSLTMVHAEDPLMCAEYMRAIKSKHGNLSSLKTWSRCRPALSESRSITKADFVCTTI